MASSMNVDSDDEDLLQPTILSKTWIITPNMVNEVLAVCPHASREKIKRDLYRTHSVTSTINRILDGEVRDLQIISEDTKPVPDYPTKDKLPGSIKDMVSSPQDKKTISSLSDTEVDTASDDSDIVIIDEKRERIFTSLKERLGKSTFKNAGVFKKQDKDCDDLPKEVSNMKTNLSTSEKMKINEMQRTSEIQDFSFNEHCEKMEVDYKDDDDNDVVLLTNERQYFPEKRPKNNHNVSEIIDLSFADDENDDNIDANHLARNLKENIKSAPSYDQLNTLDVEIIRKQKLKSTEDSSKQSTESNFCLRIESDDDSDTCEARVTDVSASESETEDLPSVFPSMALASSSSQNETEFSQEESLGDENIPKKKKKLNAEETRKRNEEKKLLKEMEKQKKKEMAENNKLAKQKAQLAKKKQKEADLLNQKSQKKEECMKVMEVYMDPEVLSKGAAADADVDPILAKLTSLGVSYSFRSHTIPKSITWKRATVEHKVGEDLEIRSHKTYSDESNVIVRLDIEVFISLVDEFKNACLGNSVRPVSSIDSFFANLTNTYTNKTVTVVIVGLEKYFRDIKTRQARQFKSAVRGDTGTTSKSRKTKNSKNTPVTVSKLEVEELLVYLELTSDIKITLCETEQDFAEFVGMFTKALAEAPFKKSQPETFSFCVDFGKKPPVKVAKDGSGLLKLWQQQLQQYHNVSANMAAAIVSVYPSPQLLVQAYRQCADEKSASLLLKDIVVRRGEGVLSTSRRIGPELSRQIYILFNSTDGQTLTK